LVGTLEGGVEVDNAKNQAQGQAGSMTSKAKEWSNKAKEWVNEKAQNPGQQQGGQSAQGQRPQAQADDPMK
jgi:hypothetical protein